MSRAKAFWSHARRHHLRTHSPPIVACHGSYAFHRRRRLHRRLHVQVYPRALHRGAVSSSRDSHSRELGATASAVDSAVGASPSHAEPPWPSPLLDSADQALVATAFALSIASTLALSLCMFYWLRCLRGTDEVTAALFVFSAFFISVGIVLPTFVSVTADARTSPRGAGIDRPEPASQARGWPARRASHGAARQPSGPRHLLHLRPQATSRTPDSPRRPRGRHGASGIRRRLSRGYPDGLPIPFTRSSRLGLPPCAPR
ncbi:MAG: hypothetical protein ACLTDR_09750 [Adlercreutzia equolifaciens]